MDGIEVLAEALLLGRLLGALVRASLFGCAFVGGYFLRRWERAGSSQ
jgi:hypothetical protein